MLKFSFQKSMCLSLYNQRYPTFHSLVQSVIFICDYALCNLRANRELTGWLKRLIPLPSHRERTTLRIDPMYTISAASRVCKGVSLVGVLVAAFILLQISPLLHFERSPRLTGYVFGDGVSRSATHIQPKSHGIPRLKRRPLPRTARPPPLIVDTEAWTRTHCLGETLEAVGEGQIPPNPNESAFMRLPISSWNDAVCFLKPDSCFGTCFCKDPRQCDCRVPVAAFARGACDKSRLSTTQETLRCPNSGPSGDDLECVVSYSLDDASTADAMILYHISLSRGAVLQDPLVRRWLLHPPERASREQIWQLVAKGESHVYYPAARDENVLAAFDESVGSDRTHLRHFSMSFYPDWDALLRPVALADKLARPALPRLSNITLIQSNCNARSGRDTFLRELMRLIPIDSFGKCHNNRDPGEFGMDRAGWDVSQANKHDLARGYKFVIAFENSIGKLL